MLFDGMFHISQTEEELFEGAYLFPLTTVLRKLNIQILTRNNIPLYGQQRSQAKTEGEIVCNSSRAIVEIHEDPPKEEKIVEKIVIRSEG